MKIINVRNNPALENPHNIRATKIYDENNTTVVHMALEPGESLKPHKTPVNVFFYVLEGNPTIEVGEGKEKVLQDSIVDSPANIMHCVYNETDSVIRFLVVKLNTK